MKSSKPRRWLGVGVVVAALAGSAAAVVANGATTRDDVTAFAPAPPAVAPFCDTLPCVFITTEDKGLQSGREMLKSATPASDCPEAKAAYEDAGYPIGGFDGPCPTSDQLKNIPPPDLDGFARFRQVYEETADQLPVSAEGSR
ncbi:MAG: hypothetical protein U0R24_00660 [Solirubrobacterales bacterium]